MRALILANGVKPPIDHILRLRATADLFIAADGAANLLADAGITPDLVVGDFDSITEAARVSLSVDRMLEAPAQETSDLDKAFACAVAHGATKIEITGALGARIDHTLTTFSLLIKYAGKVEARVVEEECEVWLVNGETIIEGEAGDTVSLIVFDAAEGVTTRGLAWPLAADTLSPGSRGVSNVLIGTTAHVHVDHGAVLVCHLRRSGEATLPCDRIQDSAQ